MSSVFGSVQRCAEQGVRAPGSRSGARVALQPLLIALALAAAVPAPAQPAAADPADAAFIERLEDRKVLRGVELRGEAVVVRGLDPLVGADDQTLIDVAQVALRIHASPGATRVEFLDPKGDKFATYTVAGGLSRTAKP